MLFLPRNPNCLVLPCSALACQPGLARRLCCIEMVCLSTLRTWQPGCPFIKIDVIERVSVFVLKTANLYYRTIRMPRAMPFFLVRIMPWPCPAGRSLSPDQQVSLVAQTPVGAPVPTYHRCRPLFTQTATGATSFSCSVRYFLYHSFTCAAGETA